MRYVIYALFQAPGAAERALADLSTAGLPADDYHIVIHKQELTQDDLRTSESDGRKGLLVGLIAGALGGSLLGWLLAGPLGLLRLPFHSALAFGMFLGTICGLLGGGIYGTGLVQDDLQRLAAGIQPGQTLLTAEIESSESRTIVDRIFRKHGAIEASA